MARAPYSLLSDLGTIVDGSKPQEQLAQLAARSHEFADRDMVLVTLLDNADSMADCCKLTASSATSMQEIYALIDSMPMRQREISKSSGVSTRMKLLFTLSTRHVHRHSL